MPDLGKYALEVGLAYGLSAVLIAGLVAASLIRAGRVRRALDRAEGRRDG
jgi:heme exporter protein D